MPLNRANQRHFHRTLYAGQLESIRLLKRDDDQRQGTVTPYILYEARRSAIKKSGQTLDGDMNVTHTTTWHIPRVELERVGINYLNPLDQIEQLDEPERGNFWQPEATTEIDVKLFGDHVCVDCLMVKPAVSRIGIPGY